MPALADIAPLSLDEIRSRVIPFCRRHEIARLEVFGSFARNEAKAGSDVDLLVTFRPGVRLGLNFFPLSPELEEILGRPVDLLTRKSVELDPNFIRRQSILGSTRDVYPA